jgi:hypothetical protein
MTSQAAPAKPGVNAAAALPFSFSITFLSEGIFAQISGIKGKTKTESPGQLSGYFCPETGHFM